MADAFRARAAAPQKGTSPDPMIARIRELQAAATPAPAVQVITFPQPRQVPFWQLPLAASIALLIGLGAGQMFLQTSETTIAGQSILDEPGVVAALASLPSGTREPLDSGAQMALVATFLDGNGGLCREFEYDQPSGMTTVAVACKDDTDWQMQLAIAAGSSTQGYAPALSLDALDAWLNATGTAAPLSAQEEAVLLGAAATN